MKGLLAIVFVALAVIGLSASAYTIDMTEQVIITQFGQPIGETITEPGLHFKTPFIQKVNRFDNRWLEWDGSADEMPTKEKTYIWVDTYARWRVKDALQFFRSVRDERGAQSRLDDIIDSETRNVIAAYELKEVVRLTNRDVVESTFDAQAAEREAVGASKNELDRPTEKKKVEKITMGRDKLTRLILKKAQRAMPDYGIELVDVQFQRVNYTRSVEEEAFNRMITERNKIAAFYRAQGEGESARIRGEVDRDLKRIESEAYKLVQEIKGDADARATSIYAEAHNRDPGFYRLLKSLESYEATIDEETLLVLSTDSDFFKLLTEMGH